MSSWTGDELETINEAQELTVATRRADGSLRQPVTVWMVRVGDDIYVRSVNGRESSWFRGAQIQHAARVRADGVERDVTLVETDDANDSVDAAYEAKYGTLYRSIVPSIIALKAREATLKLIPSDDGGVET